VIDWRHRAAALAEQLAREGVLAPSWRPAFTHTPRHLFVPVFYDDDGLQVDSSDPAWLDAVYSDASLVTQLVHDPATGLAWPTSSSTRPSLMARMLRLLDLGPNHRVLEIGTGTGYNTALLCHRNGDQRITSIDIDPTLVGDAEERLRNLSWRPTLLIGDATTGVPQSPAVDRIIATAAAPTIPPAWIRQLSLGGLIVADLRGELVSHLTVARKIGPGAVQGRFHPQPGHFMWLRPDPASPHRRPATDVPFDFTDLHSEQTSLAATAFDQPGFLFLLQHTIPTLAPLSHALTGDRAGTALHTQDDHSWMEYHPNDGGEATVTWGGPQQLWPLVRDTWRRWTGWNRPPPQRFGYTSHEDGRTDLWLDHATAVVLAHETAP